MGGRRARRGPAEARDGQIGKFDERARRIGESALSGAAEARPVALLDGAAADAWEAYNAMETTKQRHFGLLETLDLKKRNYNLDPTAEEARLLEWLLADHDAQVRRFTAASLALKATDATAHAMLFDYIGAINRIGTAADPEAARTH